MAKEWDVYVVDEVREWIEQLDDATVWGGLWSTRSSVRRSRISRSFGRARYGFCSWRSSVLLVAGDKAGQWNEWYRHAIPLAEQRYEIYLKERRAEEEGGR